MIITDDCYCGIYGNNYIPAHRYILENIRIGLYIDEQLTSTKM